MCSSTQAIADGSRCLRDSGQTIEVCLRWDGLGDPVPDQDFRMSFADPSNPAIELITGANWIVSSEQVVSGQPTGQPANIGSLTINPTPPSAEIFGVTIVRPTQQGDQPGAANVGTINLDATSWTGHSSNGSGSHITGDLTGPLTIKSDGNGDGGELWLTIDRDVSGRVALVARSGKRASRVGNDACATAL
ncbi:hypothetical protein RAS1_21260 [Phycisphaerae bacterium RAS1]|nr:hypothetical protein RAS1_21260 [Phycisphaerae bacterium RAS1]